MGSLFVRLFISWFVLAIIFLLGDKLYSWELWLQESTANTYRTFYKECRCWLLNRRGRQEHDTDCSWQWFVLMAVSLIFLICLWEITHALLIENLMLLIHNNLWILEQRIFRRRRRVLFMKMTKGIFSFVLEADFELQSQQSAWGHQS